MSSIVQRFAGKSLCPGRFPNLAPEFWHFPTPDERTVRSVSSTGRKRIIGQGRRSSIVQRLAEEVLAAEITGFQNQRQRRAANGPNGGNTGIDAVGNFRGLHAKR